MAEAPPAARAGAMTWSHFRRDIFLVIAWALGLRILFALLISDTYDPDEFVLLALSRSYAHGAVPYRDFLFFHPPGMLVLLRLLQPIINLWWPWARVFTLLIDSTTAVLTWRIGSELYGRRGGIAAGLLYGASPLALVCGVRVEQDPVITMLGFAGLAALLIKPTQRSALLAGACLAAAIWIKYPALIFLPVYLVATPRRALVIVLSTVVCLALLFAPFAPVAHDIVRETVTWQQGRAAYPLYLRLGHLAVFWVLLNLPAVIALFVTRPSRWLLLGYGLGGVFVLAPQVYYHYWVPIVPFAALLAAPLLVCNSVVLRRTLLIAAVITTLIWGSMIDLGNTTFRHFTTAAHFAWIQPAVRLLNRSASRHTYVLEDRFEYAYLAGNLRASSYFWDLRTVTTAQSLENRLTGVTVIVATNGHGPGFPDGFLADLQRRHIPVLHLGAADVWLPKS